MSTEIMYQTYMGGSGYGDPRDILGYCKESSVDVLRRVFQEYEVNHYGGLYRPVDWDFPNNVRGLVIAQKNPPRGTVVTGSIDDLMDNLKCAQIKKRRTQEDYQTAAQRMIQYHFFSFSPCGGEQNYLLTRDQKRNDTHERMLQQMLEVIHVTLDIAHPDIGDLKDLLSQQLQVK